VDTFPPPDERRPHMTEEEWRLARARAFVKGFGALCFRYGVVAAPAGDAFLALDRSSGEELLRFRWDQATAGFVEGL
jgi:hypothetical protein